MIRFVSLKLKRKEKKDNHKRRKIKNVINNYKITKLKYVLISRLFYTDVGLTKEK